MRLTISHVKSNTIADWAGVVTVGNSTGGSSTVQASDLVRPSDWNASHVTSEEPLFYYEPMPVMANGSSLSAPGIGTWYLQPFMAPVVGLGQIYMLGADAAGFLHSHVYSAASTGSKSVYQTLMNRIAIYREGTGTNFTMLERIYSADCSILATWERRISTANTSSGTIHNGLTLSFPAQWNSTGGVTYSSTAQSGTTAMTAATMASTRANNLITGAVAYYSGSVMEVFPFSTSLVGGNYWFAHMMSSTSSSTGTAGGLSTGQLAFSTHSRIFMLEFVDQAYKRLGLSVSNTSSLVDPYHGSIVSTSSAPFSTLASSDFRNQLTNARVYWHYVQSSY